MQQILRSTSSILSNTFYVDEVATNATGSVTAAVYRDAGTLLGTYNASAAGTGAPGKYTFTLPAQTDLDVLTINWSGVLGGVTQTISTEVEIVDSFYASLTEIRGLDSLSDTTKYTAAEVIEARQQAEGLFERFCGRRFVPRYARDILDGTGTDTIWLRHGDVQRIISVTEDGTTLDTSGWKITSDGRVWRSSGTFSTATPANIVVTYEAGCKYVPADIKRAFGIYVRYLLLEGNTRLPDRTLAYNADGVYVQMAQAGFNRPTGLPEVDSVLINHRQPRTSQVGGWA